MAKEEKNVPISVLVQGQQCPVDPKTGVAEIKDPLAPIEHSPYSELLPASEEWVKKYGGSDISIVAYNVFKLMEKANAKNKDENADTG